MFLLLLKDLFYFCLLSYFLVKFSILFLLKFNYLKQLFLSIFYNNYVWHNFFQSDTSEICIPLKTLGKNCNCHGFSRFSDCSLCLLHISQQLYVFKVITDPVMGRFTLTVLSNKQSSVLMCAYPLLKTTLPLTLTYMAWSTGKDKFLFQQMFTKHHRLKATETL